MSKSILISGLLCTFLGAESFDNFLQKAIKSSPYLQSSAVAVNQAKEQSSLLTRYENPSLELEYSDFNPDVGKSVSGYRVNIAQPIRLWGVAENREKLAKDTLKNADVSYVRKKSMFIRDISLSYITYMNRLNIYHLTGEEVQIAQKIYAISLARYNAGTISKALMLQAKIDYEMVQIKNKSLQLSSSQAYYALLASAGIDEELELDDNYIFIPNRDKENTNNPNILLLQAEQNKALSQAKLNANKVEWINVFAELESAPNQDITRVGFNFPLAIFNTKSQEYSIAKLENSRIGLLVENEKKQLNIMNVRLEKERSSLQELSLSHEAMLHSQEELLEMFQNGYKIANINLLQLQDIKNKLIATKKALIQIKTALNKNAVLQNYNQGKYND